MGDDNKTNISDAGNAEPTEEEIIDLLNEAPEPAEDPVLRPEPSGVYGPDPDKPNSDKPHPSDAVVNDSTKALVSTIDMVQSKICNVIAQRDDVDFAFSAKDNEKLIVVWKPVVAKYYDKIPVELVALVSTVSVMSFQFAYAKNKRENKKK